MRRSLVLGDESAHHPFRQTLPPHVRAQPTPREEPVATGLAARLARLRGRVGISDLRDFLLAYVACFVAVMAFIA